MEAQRTDGTVGRLIEAAVMAGAFSAMAKHMPEAERGLLKQAGIFSRRVEALAEEVCRSVDALPGSTDRKSGW